MTLPPKPLGDRPVSMTVLKFLKERERGVY